ncbi:MAG: bifunctional UDP-N-acetylmuramoyl-tripeptide:D-alanyl-D-alanine ligase/alanine racemase [Algoriphagus sp.]|uniref:bifunctional UDP-N-acetylmuramoyl-tripeptide:D-alanyl-D-alanine ligase/alanine racemase n=1 Tax=Algoriphagus sp. TaxID=1872435 RepID=UPI0017DFF85C|nr:bifunctional UDP-N-acetylmuramoyl-tripeptide:D-alanyl-D-alanine ligase/alanine racemase [Algoriphagus sp.]NVJ86656.1 bifunctional UDP-N-acetylmuramoyl-tripeptide:D-alanyl-D-alanine ligase/alanine racemase [Algoriphagus sp.]
MISALTILEIAKICKGKLIENSPESEINQIVIDSRQAFSPSKSLFVALTGAKAKGTDFIAGLIQRGVRNFLVPTTYLPTDTKANFIQVENPHKALQDLAAVLRSRFTGPVIGITGSNGKTIVKEWLGQLLSQEFTVAKSPKSYNSQVGVPLSVFEINPYHQVAILEAGISKGGEMESLERIIRPELGILTNIGSAHDAGFSDRLSKLREKLSLFKDSKFLIYCKDQGIVSKEIEYLFPSEKLISWSDQPGSDFTRAIKFKEDENRILLIKKDLSTLTFRTQLRDAASLENIIHAIVAALTLGLSPQSIQRGIEQLRPVDMRLTLKAGLRDCLLIDDTYNHDLAGLRVALDFIQQQRPKRRKILILSDFLQQGKPEWIYSEAAQLIRNHQLDLVLGVGRELSLLAESGVQNLYTWERTEDLLANLREFKLENDLILITGARPFGLEKVVQQLQQRIHGTTLEINLNALTHNFNFYRRLLKPETKVMVMVKAFAYGGGAPEIANHIQTMGADYLAVAFTDEGVALRQQGIHLPIMVLNPLEESFASCLEYRLEPVVFSPEFFENLAKWTKAHSETMKVHLDLDTGMHRLGFEKQHLEELKGLIQENPQLQVTSLFTHLAAADESEEKKYTLQQLEDFKEMAAALLPLLPLKPLLHALNSAGIVTFPDFQFDMVRLGIGLYGVEVTGNYSSDLLPISKLKTTVSQVKTLPSGATIGYSRRGKLPKGGKIATLPIGYADGYDRRFSNGQGYVLINEKKAPVIGNVCMDMVMVDVSKIQVEAGDEAIIYGAEIPLAPLAKKIGTIPYELLTHISSRVKRIYFLD